MINHCIDLSFTAGAARGRFPGFPVPGYRDPGGPGGETGRQHGQSVGRCPPQKKIKESYTHIKIASSHTHY